MRAVKRGVGLTRKEKVLQPPSLSYFFLFEYGTLRKFPDLGYAVSHLSYGYFQLLLFVLGPGERRGGVMMVVVVVLVVGSKNYIPDSGQRSRDPVRGLYTTGITYMYVGFAFECRYVLS